MAGGERIESTSHDDGEHDDGEHDDGVSRRGFLAAGAAGVAAATLWRTPVARSAPRRSLGPPAPSPTPTRYALIIEGRPMGFLIAAEGGNPYGEVIETLSPTGASNKHIGAVKYEDFSLRMGMSMNRGVWDWISAMLGGRPIARDGSVAALDSQLNVIEETTFINAMISEIRFPESDASTKEHAYLTLKIRPEATERVKGQGTLPSRGSKAWLASNFRFQDGGGSLATARVSKVDAFTIKQTIVVGERPGPLEVGDLRVTFAAADRSPTWDEWFEAHVLKGESSDERGGSLTYLSSNLSTVLGTVHFVNMGIFGLAEEPAPSGGETIRRTVAQMYVEQIRFEVPRTA